MTTFFHIGTEVDGRWAKGPFDTAAAAIASMMKYAPIDPVPTTAPAVSYSEIGGRHYVEEKPSTFKTDWDVERYLEAADARECGMDTGADRKVLARHEGNAA